jgi:Protein of unknown function (DUF2889)
LVGIGPTWQHLRVNSADTRTRLHTRAYEIESVLEDDRHFRLIGHLRDVNPNGLWGIGQNEPLTIHHMQVELLVEAQTLTIVDVLVNMHVRPQLECSDILPAYDQLIGLSIARGFTHKVREMFGGPRACTHIGAMLNAMAPVAVQSLWAFFSIQSGQQAGDGERNAPTADSFERNRNTCHVWAEDGPMFEMLANGEEPPVPLWAIDRLGQKGIPVEIWRKQSR